MPRVNVEEITIYEFSFIHTRTYTCNTRSHSLVRTNFDVWMLAARFYQHTRDTFFSLYDSELLMCKARFACSIV